MLLPGYLVNILDMYMSETECTFVSSLVLKHSRPGYQQQTLILIISCKPSLVQVYEIIWILFITKPVSP